MKLRTYVAACSAVLATACGSDSNTTDKTPQPGDVGTVSGALASSGSGSAAASGSTVLVSSVDDDGNLKVVGQGTLDASGRFDVTDVDAGSGPFVVQVMSSANATLASVIVPEDIADGDHVRTNRLSAETTTEVDTMLDILAGDADRSDIDTISLMTWITADLAAHSDSEQLATAVSLALETSLATSAAEGHSTSADAMEQGELAAWTAFATAADASADASVQAQAWAEFLNTTAGSSSSDVQAAAGLAFASTFTSSNQSRTDALRIAAELSGYASWSAERDAVSGSSVQTAVEAKLELAYDSFFESLDDAQSESDIDSASVALAAAITGRAEGSQQSSSALGILIAGENSGSDDNVNAAIDATADIATSFQSSIDSAMSGSADSRANAIAEAYATFRGELDAKLEASLDASITSRLQSFTDEATAQSGGHLAALLDLDLDLLHIVGDIGIALSGSIDVGLSGDGALGLDGLDGTFDAAAQATVAVLVQIAADGTTHDVDSGTINDGHFSFDSVTEATGTFVVELRNASGDVEGALAFDNITSGSANDIGMITQESTIEARVMLQRLADGENVGDIDSDRLDAMIDGAIAAAVATDSDNGQSDIEALAMATFAAQLVAEQNDDMNEARAEAALAFEAVIEATSSNTVLGDASEARTRLEGAFALQAALHSAFTGSSSSTRTTELDAAVSVLVSATSAANNGDELDLAGATFVNAMLGFASTGNESDGLLGDIVSGDLTLGLTQQVVIETATDSAFAAGVTFRAAIQAATQGAISNGMFDGEGFATGWASAQATYDAALSAALDLSTLSLDEGDAQVITTLVTHLSLSFSGVYAGN